MTTLNLKRYIGIILFLILLSLGVYLDGSQRLVMLIAALGLMLVLNEENVALCFFAQTFMCDSLQLIPSVSFSALAALILLLKTYIFGRKVRLNIKYYILVTFIIIAQLISIITFGNDVIDVVRFSVNLFVLLYFMKYFEVESKSTLLLPSIASISVLLACLIGLTRSATVDYLGLVRYSGIWIDDNFCGMYCAIGIISSLYVLLHNKYTALFTIPSILLSIQMAALSMSRTFVVVLLAIFTFFVFSILNNKNIRGFKRFVLIIISFIGVGFLITRVASQIIEQRGLDVDGDITNGRIELSLQSLEAFSHHPTSWLLGAGVSNSANFKSQNGLTAMSSHNTYVDMLVELGIPIGVLTISIVFGFFWKLSKRLKFNISYIAYFCLIIGCYMGTLTLGQYSILYIALGAMISYAKRIYY